MPVTVDRYIVSATQDGKVASLHCLASSEAEAASKLRQHFGGKVTGWEVTAINLRLVPDQSKGWKGNGSYFMTDEPPSDIYTPDSDD